MAIGTPVLLGTGTNKTSGTTFATTADSPAGSLNLLIVAGSGSGTTATQVTSISESAGNSYSQIVQSTASASRPAAAIYACINSTNNLPSGSTFTVNVNAGKYQAFAWSVSGCNGGSDIAVQAVSGGGSNTSVSISTGTLGAANELIVANLAANNGLGTFTEASGWTAPSTSNRLDGQDAAYKIVSATTSQTYNPSWTTSAADSVCLASFKATGGINYTLTLTSGSYSVTGDSSIFAIGLPLTAGSYSINGSPVTPAIGMPATSGSYAIAGQLVNSALGMSVSTGSYAISGGSTTPAVGIVAQPGSYGVSGSPISTPVALSMITSAGSYSVSGSSVTPSVGMLLSAGTYTITGDAADFQKNLTMPLADGTYTITGAGAILNASNAPVSDIHFLPFHATTGQLKSF